MLMMFFLNLPEWLIDKHRRVLVSFNVCYIFTKNIYIYIYLFILHCYFLSDMWCILFVSDDIIYRSSFLNPMKLRNKKLTSRDNLIRGKLLLPRRKNTGSIDTVIQEITDEDGILEDITIESSSTV